ncbi:hypothetical protein ACJ6WF_47335 [Streptomyces sp. MMS24-I2-30]|uniref:hypothetical protein n=1 Tax=Streptomyces sp. MMS24-I2-30 TaxID=3351564 RepID=UPI003896D434
MRRGPLAYSWDGGDGSTNYIPVDAAARAAVQVTLTDTATSVYHLTNAHSTPLRDTFRALTQILEIPEAVIHDGVEGFTDADHFLNHKIGVYRPYLRCAKESEQTNVARLIGPVDLPVDVTVLAAHLAWYVQGPGGEILARSVPCRLSSSTTSLRGGPAVPPLVA